MTRLFAESWDSRALEMGIQPRQTKRAQHASGNVAYERERKVKQRLKLQKNQPKARGGANAQKEFTAAEQREQGTAEPTTQPTPTGVDGQPKNAGEM